MKTDVPEPQTEKLVDYAKTENKEAWLRHPVLGDPSFDTFEKLGKTVHKSEPPYEWAVNGSLFRDQADGVWYYFAGLYAYGYAMKDTNGKTICSDFILYRSADEGKSWQDLGRGFPDGFCFDGYTAAADRHPDVSMTYDPETKLYWLSYDWGTAVDSWEHAHNPPDKNYGGGAALAYAKSPAGPFTRLPKPIFSNFDINKKIGRFSRAYATTVFKRKSDWIALVLCDSNKYYSWGLACMTAKTPYGEWSEPAVLLSVDRPEYYPAPVEFYPCFVAGETMYAPATSVSFNRNYQTMHEAPLEEAHKPEAWALTGDGNAWHSRLLPEEKYGIWGQTYHGFVHDGKLTVMYPSRDERGFGTLSVAQRAWDTPYSDGYTFSGHAGKSISPLLRAYENFTLETEFAFTGTVELAFDYHGILGPNRPASDAAPAREALSDYKALRLSAGKFEFTSVDKSSKETVLFEGEYSCGETVKLTLEVEGGSVKFDVNGTTGEISGIPVKGGPLALIAHEFSILTCSKFAVQGEEIPCVLKYQAYDAMLGAGQNMKDWIDAKKLGLFSIGENALVNSAHSGQIYGKWNIIGKGFAVYAAKSPKLGKMRVVVDGEYKETVNLHSEKEFPPSPVYTYTFSSYGRHGIALYPESDSIVLDVLEVYI